MRRLIVRYGAQALGILAPFITLEWSFLDWIGYHADGNGNLAFLWFQGQKDQVQFRVALGVSAIAFVLSAISEIYDLYLPMQRMEKFRETYLDEQKARWAESLGENVRVNVMFARRVWYFAFLRKRLYWVWHDGYAPPFHRDANMPFWLSQGVCGRAFRERTALFVDLRGYWPEQLAREFRLPNRKVQKTSDVKSVLSVPIFSKSEGPTPTYETVGIISIDAVSDEGTDLLEKNWERLGHYFLKVGFSLAQLRG